MKRLLLVLALLAGATTACADETGDANDIDVNASDIEVIEKEVDGQTYMCLFVYVDGYRAGGPAMWCERQEPK